MYVNVLPCCPAACVHHNKHPPPPLGMKPSACNHAWNKVIKTGRITDINHLVNTKIPAAAAFMVISQKMIRFCFDANHLIGASLALHLCEDEFIIIARVSNRPIRLLMMKLACNETAKNYFREIVMSFEYYYIKLLFLQFYGTPQM